MISWDEAKQKVAERHFCDTWKDLFIIADSVGAELDVFYREVSELMQQHAANEAVREDREHIRNTCLQDLPKLDKSGSVEGYYWILNGQKFQELPLPYPEAK